MKRRSFFSLFGLLPALPFIKSKEIPEHEYDWTVRPCTTTDPNCQPLQYGERAPRIYLDGRLMTESGLKITRCKSGDAGWIEFYVCGPDGIIVTNNCEAVRDVMRGRVEVVPR